jgi:hypothetical protein
MRFRLHQIEGYPFRWEGQARIIERKKHAGDVVAPSVGERCIHQ